MKRLKTFLVLPVVFLLCSCTSLTPEKINALATLAGTAASLGAQAWLAAHPEHKGSFDQVVSALSAFLAAGKTDQTEFVNLMSSLPTDALVSPKAPAELYISPPSKDPAKSQEGELVIYDKGTAKATKVEGAATLPVMRATVAGLKKASMPKLPSPTARVNLKPPRVESLEKSGATTTVANATDYTPNEFGNPVVTLRWLAAAGKIYEIQHREGKGEWAPYAKVVNVEGAGLRTWSTPWNAAVELGEWRVIRLR